MTAPAPVNPFKTRLGREIYVLAALLAGLPIFVIGLVSIAYLSSSHVDRAREELGQAARNYGSIVFERLLGAVESAHAIGGTTSTVLDPIHYAAYAIIGADGALASQHGTLDIPDAVYGARSDRPRLIVARSSGRSELFLALEAATGLFVGRVNADHLWGSESDHPFATDFCVLTAASADPLHCSATLPEPTAMTVAARPQSQGGIDWQNDDGARSIGEYWELFVPSAIDGPTLRILASQPEAVALEQVLAFRDIYVPGLFVTVGFTLLAAGAYARRTLDPLSQLLSATQRFARRDFEARSTVGRDDEFKQLSDAMNGMASELDREFRSREGLAAIDQLILRGESIDVLCKAALLHALATTQVSLASIMVLDADSVNAAKRYRMKRSRLHTRSDAVTIAQPCQSFLSEQPKGIVVSRGDVDERIAPLLDANAETSYLLPIVVNARLCGTLLCSALAGETLDEQTQRQVRDLNDRIAIAVDYTRKSAELHRRAFFDELTGLPNRESCFQRINEEIERARAARYELALMFVDLDGFKNINDTLGHVAGDEVIRQAADRITHCVGRRGITARLGGDEFAVVMPLSEDDAPASLASSILEELRVPFRIAGTQASIGASIGTSRYPRDGVTHTELLRKADAAMYRAKDAGRGQVFEYSMTMGLMIDRRLRLELDLGQALARDEMRIAYQPQMDLRSGRINAAEALLRWTHGKEGPISPAEFIPIAEESGQIVTLGNWILFNACRQYRSWRANGLAIERIAVNVSAKQLRSHEFMQRVEDCIREFDLGLGELELELTESTLVAETEVSNSLKALKRLGVAISIDDFGTGYSSLGYLQKLEFDCVKIDRTFVSHLPQDRDAAAIINAVVAMCHTLGKSVVAEGIETESQLQHLANANVDIGQGYFLGKPMPPEAFYELLSAPACEPTMAFKRIVNVPGS